MSKKHDLIIIIRFNELTDMFNEIMMNNRPQCKAVKILIS